MAAASAPHLVLETAPTPTSAISDVSRPLFFSKTNFESSFARLFTKIALLRASPVSDWMLQDFLMTVLAEFMFEIVPKSLQKMVCKKWYAKKFNLFLFIFGNRI